MPARTGQVWEGAADREISQKRSGDLNLTAGKQVSVRSGSGYRASNGGLAKMIALRP